MSYTSGQRHNLLTALECTRAAHRGDMQKAARMTGQFSNPVGASEAFATVAVMLAIKFDERDSLPADMTADDVMERLESEIMDDDS